MAIRKEENVPGQFIHPLISFLVSGMSEIRNLLNSNPPAAIKYLMVYDIFLDPSVKKKLEKQRTQLRAWYVHPQLTFIELLTTVNDIVNALYEEGYFLGAKVRVIEVGGDHK